MMKLFRMFGRNIRDAFKSVFRNFSLSLASISCITITLIIVALSLLASLNVNNFAKMIKEDVTIVVYIKKDVPESDFSKIESKINHTDNVATCIFKSKEEVKKDFQETNEFFNTFMSEWSETENPLKDSYKVTVTEIEDIKKTAQEIQSIDGVDFVDYGEAMVDKLIISFKAIQKVSVAIVIALILVTTFLIVNTIKLTIFSRKREISIMRLVGASNFTIKNPFVIEGMILGVLGSIIPIIITTYGYLALYNHFDGYLYSPLFSLIKPEPFIYWVSLMVLVIGIVVGMIGSYRAVRKYLKV